MLRKWDTIPQFMKCDEVKEYYDILKKRKVSLLIKRIFDILCAWILLIILAIPMGIIVILIKTDSHGPIFFLQERVTAYGKIFKIHKFRTMIDNADKIGPTITVDNDNRITRIGKMLRKYRLDELPQLFDILSGNMSFVGSRPELPQYVKKYTKEMKATLLLPAGLTSEASVRYRDEARLLNGAKNTEEKYVKEILPDKMKYNLESIRKFNLLNELRIIYWTILEIFVKHE